MAITPKLDKPLRRRQRLLGSVKDIALRFALSEFLVEVQALNPKS